MSFLSSIIVQKHDFTGGMDMDVLFGIVFGLIGSSIALVRFFKEGVPEYITPFAMIIFALLGFMFGAAISTLFG